MASSGLQTDLASWLELPPQDRPRLVDVRTEVEFETRRLAPSTCLPADDLVDLLFELPETTTPLAIVASTATQGEGVLSVLREKGWLRVEFMLCADEDGFWARAEAEEGLTGRWGRPATLRPPPDDESVAWSSTHLPTILAVVCSTSINMYSLWARAPHRPRRRLHSATLPREPD